MPTTREYHSFTQVRDALHGRLDRNDAPSLFDRIDWFDLLHRHCFPDHDICVLHHQDNGAEAWLFLTSARQRNVQALANWYSFHWSPILIGAEAPEDRTCLLDGLFRHLIAIRSGLDLYPLEQTHDILASLRRTGWFAFARQMGGRYLLDLDGRDFATYWAQRPGRLRNLVRRKGRNSPYRLTIDDHLTDDLWADYVSVHARSWKEPEPGLPFLHALASQESAAGTLRLGFARLDGEPIAAQLWTVEHGVALIHKLSHDRAHDAGSPGTLLSHAMFARAIDGERVARIDYGTGDNPYKVDWMERRIPLYQIDAFNPRHASTWLPAARTAISALVG